MQVHVALRQLGWSRLTHIVSPVWFLSMLFKNFFGFILWLVLSPHQWTDFDDLYVIRRGSVQGSAFWGFRSYCCSFWGSNPKKLYFGGVNRPF